MRSFRQPLSRQLFSLLMLVAGSLVIWICWRAGHYLAPASLPAMANLAGFGLLLFVLLLARLAGWPVTRFAQTMQPLLREAPFAFVPVSAGFVSVWYALGSQRLLITLVTVTATLLGGYLLYQCGLRLRHQTVTRTTPSDLYDDREQ